MSDQLAQARESVSRSQAEFAATVAWEFASRWQEACDRLAALRAEVAQWSAALRITISTPAPYVPTINVVHGNPEVKPVALLAGPIAPAALPRALATVDSILDRLDGAAGNLAALRQAADLDSRRRALSRIRAGDPGEQWSLYRVTRPFTIWACSICRGCWWTRVSCRADSCPGDGLRASWSRSTGWPGARRREERRMASVMSVK
jgi:hypothetical protein